MTNYKILEYRTREELDNVLSLLDRVATKDELGRATAEHKITVPNTQTRQGKGQRRKKQGKKQRWEKKA
jgi:hypothetical protein